MLRSYPSARIVHQMIYQWHIHTHPHQRQCAQANTQYTFRPHSAAPINTCARTIIRLGGFTSLHSPELALQAALIPRKHFTSQHHPNNRLSHHLRLFVRTRLTHLILNTSSTLHVLLVPAPMPLKKNNNQRVKTVPRTMTKTTARMAADAVERRVQRERRNKPGGECTSTRLSKYSQY
jgi:hypothetical protein